MTDIPVDDIPEREVGHRRIGAGEGRSIVIRRRCAAPIEDVWVACTQPDRLDRWFLRVAGDLHQGGRFSLEGNASGEIVRCDPPRELHLTWVYGERPVDEVWLRLAPGPDGDTRLELEHATVSTLVEAQGRLVDVIPGLGQGWELPLVLGLPRYLRGELPDVPATEWFEFTPEVMEIAARTNDLWTTVAREAGATADPV
jgi:uncharacterized protein YndB with AHSA1/START domain